MGRGGRWGRRGRLISAIHLKCIAHEWKRAVPIHAGKPLHLALQTHQIALSLRLTQTFSVATLSQSTFRFQ